MIPINLRFKIGIFYTETQWVENIFNQIIEYLQQYPNLYNSCTIYNRQWDKRIKITPIYEICFVKAGVKAKGQKFDRIYYAWDIQNEDVLRYMIYPCLNNNIPLSI